MASNKSIKPNQLTINISHKTIIYILGLFIAIRFLYEIREILLILFIAFLLVVAVNPVIDWLEKKRVPRAVSSIGILLITFAVIISTAVSLITPLFGQTQLFLARIPNLVAQLAPYNIDFSSFANELSSIPADFLKIALETFSGLVTFFTLLVVSFYLLQTRPQWSRYMHTLFGDKGENYYHALTELEIKLGHWVRGVLVLMLTVGVVNYLGFTLIGLPFAIPLGVIAGILEIVPNIGPTIAAVPAALVGFTISPTHGIFAIVVSIIVQQLENHILVPNIMRKTTGLHPVITIVSILIGYRLGGATLAILSLPLVLSLQVILTHFRLYHKAQQAIAD